MHSLAFYILLLLLLKMHLFLLYVHDPFTLRVCLCTTCVSSADGGQNRAVGSAGTGVTDGRELPCVFRTQNQVLWKSSQALNCEAISQVPLFITLISCKTALVLMSKKSLVCKHQPQNCCCVQKGTPIHGNTS